MGANRLVHLDASEELALLMARSSLNSLQKKRSMVLLDQIIQNRELKQRFLKILSFNQIEGHAALHFKRIKVFADYCDIFTTCVNRLTKLSQDHEERISAIRPILRDFQKMGVVWVLLKGNAISKEIYGCPHYKSMNDIDILVHRKDLPKVKTIYQKHGLISVFSLSERNHRKQEKYSHHWPSFATKNLKCFIGTHWNLASPMSSFKFDEDEWWLNVEPQIFDGFSCFRLHPDDFLLHLCFHLPYYKTGVKEVADIFNFAEKFKSKVSIIKVIEKAQRSNTLAHVFFQLSIAYQMSRSPVLKKMLEKFKNQNVSMSWSEKQLLNKKTRSAETLLFSKSESLTKIERDYAFFLLAPSFTEKARFLARMWKGFLRPTQPDLNRLYFLYPDSGAIKNLTAAWTLSWYFSQDLGWKMHSLLLLDHHVKLLKAGTRDLRLRLSGRKPESLKLFLRRKGLSDKTIQTVYY